MNGFRRGIRLGVDVGRARIGIARCDPDGLLAVPVQTVPRDAHSVSRIAQLVAEYEPLEIVVGLPINLRGEDTASTIDARAFATTLSRHCGVAVRLIDERLSTVTAQQALRASGRAQRSSRAVVDQAAAVVLLQHAIDTEKGTGAPAGDLLILDEESH